MSFGNFTTKWPGLVMHSAVYDTSNNAFLLFGGTPDFEIPLTSVYSVKCDKGSRNCSTTDLSGLSDQSFKVPEPRFGHIAVWLSGARKMVVFGGRTADRYNDKWNPRLLNDLWTFDPNAATWQQLLTVSNDRYAIKKYNMNRTGSKWLNLN
jgi:hypothetical protein